MAHSKSVKDLYFAPTRSALPSSSILKIISVGKCELYSEKYSYHSSEIYGLNRVL